MVVYDEYILFFGGEEIKWEYEENFMIKWKVRWMNYGNKERVVVVFLGKEFNLCVNNERMYVKGYDILIFYVVML